MARDDQYLAYIGRTAGGFRLDRFIGVGPVACVFAGTQLALDRKVAIRMLRPEFSREETHVGEFLAAGRAAASLLHANITPIFNVISDEGLHFIAQEYVQDSSLEDLSSRDTLDIERILDIGAEVIDALAFAHAQGVVHGNLRTSNIFINEDYHPRICDFAPARRYLMPHSVADPRRPYMAPELSTGGQPTWASDIFSLGTIIYYLLTARTPYPVDLLEQGADARDIKWVDPATLNPKLHTPLCDLLKEMLAWPSAARPSTMRKLGDAWREMTRKMLDFEVSRPDISLLLDAPNKRKYRRLRSEMEVDLSVLHATPEMSRKIESTVRNISENGAYVPTQTPLPTGTIVSLQFNLAQQGGVRVKALGIVRWVEETRASRGMGVQFLQVTTHDRAMLKDYVDDAVLNDMSRILTQTPLHRKMLRKLMLEMPGRSLHMREMLRGTGAGQTLALRALKDFEQLQLICIKGDIIEPVPISRRIQDSLAAASRRSR